MISQVYYLVRSKVDGKYLAAHPNPDLPERYLLVFQENFDARSYLNKYGGDMKEKLTIESITPIQLKSIIERWSFSGVGVVKDPLLPNVEFLRQ
ncbi:hypothetical protein IQ235_01685 [Oscillatoriales cyanobacterium LEGE 11467]|uniref:Uncharacterized protein n=1 Tax=Zarconia navalis LEGE 11467 TaxID=1828826 RepID=A0A928Z863_9CYAN|nr:hypothetical protein [Zarconia navalis]MBE9039506.1 hypothetical protein [Zarconia navalis LEGE 11467]